MQTLEELTSVFRSLYQNNPEAVALFDAQGRLVSCNRCALEMIGAGDEAEVIGTHYLNAVTRSERDRVREGFARALAGSHDHVSVALQLDDERTMPADITLFAAQAEGTVVGVFAQVREALAMHVTEASLTASQERLRSLFEYHSDAIAVLKANGVISRVNVALEQTTGFFGEDLIGRAWLTLFGDDHRRNAEAAFEAAACGEPAEFDAEMTTRTGAQLDVHLKLVPLRVAGEVEGAYAIARDVSAQRAAERALTLQAERIRQLYVAASARGPSVEAQIDNTLALGCEMFGFDYGYVTRFDGETTHIVNAVGEGAGVQRGAALERDRSFSRHLLGRRTLSIPNIDEEPWRSDPARTTAPWLSYFAVQLLVKGTVFGGLVFASRKPREELSALDRDLVQLMALFVAAALERARYAETIEQLAYYDPLTGLPNRVLFDDRARQALTAAKRYARGFAVMYLDLDNFKEINDRYGHPEGDRVLEAVAERLLRVLRESDTLARFGGDEFVVLQPVVQGKAQAETLAKKLVHALQAPIATLHGEHRVNTSVGIAIYPGDGESTDALIEAADKALYHAKRAGRNTWQFTPHH